jgi:hypothetical protein
MKKSFLAGLTTVLVMVGMWCGSVFAYTFQNFEDGTLDGWTAGGRRQGYNKWGVSEYAGSQMAYLHHKSFTELTLSKSFSYSPDMIFSFDAEFSINGDKSPSPNGNSQYNSDNVYYALGFRDVNGKSLGYKRYVAETSYWWTNNLDNTSLFLPNGLEHYEYDMSSLASELGIDTNDIDSIALAFGGYSPWYSGSNMIVRFDNVGYSASSAPVPEPATMILVGLGLVGLAGVRRKLKK